ncbi:MAG: hypothetical protein OP8BY_1852 [Candidatus Saccharicenans subterraneus]|uniref:Uncharacterized protein n=1 Tax=Candidatus Saccharicenans subterraneus TaxID=2508984 RepID=A0A3E2BNF9_9BACT|nr:MAG: hypothetical protein OP8BY_1852 [Candidatus Saccharicenans subterraneum]
MNTCFLTCSFTAFFLLTYFSLKSQNAGNPITIIICQKPGFFNRPVPALS